MQNKKYFRANEISTWLKRIYFRFGCWIGLSCVIEINYHWKQLVLKITTIFFSIEDLITIFCGIQKKKQWLLLGFFFIFSAPLKLDLSSIIRHVFIMNGTYFQVFWKSIKYLIIENDFFCEYSFSNINAISLMVETH